MYIQSTQRDDWHTRTIGKHQRFPEGQHIISRFYYYIHMVGGCWIIIYLICELFNIFKTNKNLVCKMSDYVYKSQEYDKPSQFFVVADIS